MDAVNYLNYKKKAIASKQWMTTKNAWCNLEIHIQTASKVMNNHLPVLVYYLPCKHTMGEGKPLKREKTHLENYSEYLATFLPSKAKVSTSGVQRISSYPYTKHCTVQLNTAVGLHPSPIYKTTPQSRKTKNHEKY